MKLSTGFTGQVKLVLTPCCTADMEAGNEASQLLLRPRIVGLDSCNDRGGIRFTSRNIKRSFQCLHRLARITIIAMEVANGYPVLVSTWPASIEWFHNFLSVANQLQALAYLRSGSREALGPELASQPKPVLRGGTLSKSGRGPTVLQTALVITLHDTAP